jgi:hypothetical protein
MRDLIDVFRMSELPTKTRADLIVKIGEFINGKYGMNISEPVVFELVSILEPQHPILSSPHYLRRAGKESK